MSTMHRPRLLIAIIVCSLSSGSAFPKTDPLPSWNEGAAKQAIVKFVQDTTTQGSSTFVPPAERTLALHDEAKRQGWTVISMTNDWKRVFSFAPKRGGSHVD